MAKIQPKKKQVIQSTVDEQEKLLQQLHKKDTRKKVQRVTIDFPQYMYDQIKEEVEETGQTLKGFMVGLVRDHFTRKEMK